MAAEVCSFGAGGDWFFHHCFFGVARKEEAGCNAERFRENTKGNKTFQAYILWSHSDITLLWAAGTVRSMWVAWPKLSCFVLEGYIAMWCLELLGPG